MRRKLQENQAKRNSRKKKTIENQRNSVDEVDEQKEHLKRRINENQRKCLSLEEVE